MSQRGGIRSLRSWSDDMIASNKYGMCARDPWAITPSVHSAHARNHDVHVRTPQRTAAPVHRARTARYGSHPM